MKEKIKFLTLWLALVCSETTSQLYLKSGAMDSSASHKVSAGILLGYGFLVFSFLLWMQILKSTRLSLALSATSVVYVTVAVAAHFVLGEALTPVLILGCLFISAGVFVLGTP